MFTSTRQKTLLTRCAKCSSQSGPIRTQSMRQWHRQSSTSTTATTNSSSSSSSDATSSPQKRVIFSGIQPTGIPHLGNYLGALRSWVELQHTSPPDTKLIYSIVDLHALTIPKEASLLRRWRKQALATLLAVGIDPDKATLFFQSGVPAHSELMWILSTSSSMGYLSRMTQWKSKLQIPESSTLEDSAARARLKLGLFSYPVLQAADVLVHRANYVPVGEDQKQHIEFAREVAKGFNHLHGPVLTVPEPLISQAKRVMSLKDPRQKMSKSHGDPRSMILLTDSPKEIKDKLRLALTDSSPSVTYDPVNRPGVSNLLEILSHIESGSGSTTSDRSVTEIATDHASSNLRTLKEHVANSLIELLEPIRERYTELLAEDDKRSDGRSYLEEVARRGEKEARANADITMNSVREAIGLI